MVRCDWASTRAGAGHRGHITSAMMTATGFLTPSLLSLEYITKASLVTDIIMASKFAAQKKKSEPTWNVFETLTV